MEVWLANHILHVSILLIFEVYACAVTYTYMRAQSGVHMWISLGNWHV